MSEQPVGQYEPTHALTLNGLDLIGGVGPEGYVINALGDDFTFGNPAQVVTEVLEQILDGSLATVESYDNREATIPLRVSGVDGPSLAAGERALTEAVRGIDGRGLLIWTPPSIAAEPSVFEVVTADMQLTANDILERQDFGPERYWTLTLACKPFARSLDRVEIPGLPVSSSAPDVVIDDGASLTNWSTANEQLVRHQLVPNPVFETNLATWSSGGGTSSIAWKSSGMEVSAPKSGANARSYVNGPGMAVEPGVAYQIYSRLWFYVTGIGSVGTARGGVKCRFFNASGDLLIDSDVTIRTLPNGSWSATQSGPITAPATAATMRIYPFVYWSRSNDFAWKWNASRITVTEYVAGPETIPFDGRTPDTDVIDYAWTGTADNSPSTATYLPPVLHVPSGTDRVACRVWGDREVILERTAPIPTGQDTPYLRVHGLYGWDLPPAELLPSKTDGVSLTFYIDGNQTSPDLLQMNGGQFTAAFYLPDGASTSIEVAALCPTGAFDDGAYLAVEEITANSTAVDSTGRQTSRTIPVYGSMRTEADIEVTSATSGGVPVALGDQTLVYSTPTRTGIATPDLRQWRVAGGTLFPDSSTISGSYEELATNEAGAVTFEIPAGQVNRGTHALWASLHRGINPPLVYRFRWSVTVATAFTTSVVTDYADVYLPATPAALVPIGHVALPPSDAGASADATITLKLWADTGGVNFDEGWAFNVADGQVSLVDTSGGVSMVRLSSATIDHPTPGCWIGDADSEVNTIAAGSRAAFDQHRFPPGSISVTTIAASSPSVSTALGYYPRWHTHPAPLPAEAEGGGP